MNCLLSSDNGALFKFKLEINIFHSTSDVSFPIRKYCFINDLIYYNIILTF